jgi:hypothetical protein
MIVEGLDRQTNLIDAGLRRRLMRDASSSDAYHLQLDDDVLAPARVLARQKRMSLGAVINTLVRQALVAPAENGSGAASNAEKELRNSVPLLPWKAEGAPMDLELVSRLRDELG